MDLVERRERADRMLAAYVHDDLTLAQIGRRHFVTRERVRQEVNWYDRTLYMLARRRRKARIRHERSLDDGVGSRVLHCKLCGEVFTTTNALRLFCSPVHYAARCALRYQIVDDRDNGRNRREIQRMSVANWTLRHRDQVTPAQVRYSERVVAGETAAAGDVKGCWLIPGSLAFHWALRAYVCEWPIFDEFHPDVQQQVREWASGETAAV